MTNFQRYSKYTQVLSNLEGNHFESEQHYGLCLSRLYFEKGQEMKALVLVTKLSFTMWELWLMERSLTAVETGMINSISSWDKVLVLMCFCLLFIIFCLLSYVNFYIRPQISNHLFFPLLLVTF